MIVKPQYDGSTLNKMEQYRDLYIQSLPTDNSFI
jgi:hypothetical protein